MSQGAPVEQQINRRLAGYGDDRINDFPPVGSILYGSNHPYVALPVRLLELALVVVRANARRASGNGAGTNFTIGPAACTGPAGGFVAGCCAANASATIPIIPKKGDRIMIFNSVYAALRLYIAPPFSRYVNGIEADRSEISPARAAARPMRGATGALRRLAGLFLEWRQARRYIPPPVISDTAPSTSSMRILKLFRCWTIFSGTSNLTISMR